MLESASVMFAFETIEFCIFGRVQTEMRLYVCVVAFLFGTIILGM